MKSKIWLIALGMLLLGAVSAQAFGEIRYPDRPLNLRNGRSAKAKWVGSLYPGQKVRIAFLKNGWVAIFEPGETKASESAAVGYSNVKYLKSKRTRHEPKPWGELVYTPRKLNVRERPTVRAKKLGQLAPMEHVRIDFPDDDWVMVFSPTATIRSEMNGRGYSSGKYFEPATQASKAKAGIGGAPKPVVEQTQSPAKTVQPSQSADWGTLVTLKRKVNLRAKRTSGSKYLRTLKPGETVRVDLLKSGWYAVFDAKETTRSESKALGFALASYVNTPPAPQPARAQSSAPVQPSAASPKAGTQRTIVIDREALGKAKRPDPTPDKQAHGYQYRLLEKSETKRYGESWITLKVFLSTTKLPGTQALQDFATSLWKEHKRATKNLAVMIYVSGQNTEDLSYAVIRFDDAKMLELWVRKATLFGTDFL